MEKQYRFAVEQINLGRTVLVYQWPVQRKVYRVNDTSRLGMRNGNLTVDGKECARWTVVVKP